MRKDAIGSARHVEIILVLPEILCHINSESRNDDLPKEEEQRDDMAEWT